MFKRIGKKASMAMTAGAGSSALRSDEQQSDMLVGCGDNFEQLVQHANVSDYQKAYDCIVSLGDDVFSRPCSHEYHLQFTERLYKTGGVDAMVQLLSEAPCVHQAGSRMSIRLLGYISCVCDATNPMTAGINRCFQEADLDVKILRVMKLPTISDDDLAGAFSVITHMVLLSPERAAGDLQEGIIQIIIDTIYSEHKYYEQHQKPGRLINPVTECLLAMSMYKKHRRALINAGAVTAIKDHVKFCFRSAEILANLVGSEEDVAPDIDLDLLLTEIMAGLREYGRKFKSVDVNWRTLVAVHSLACADVHKLQLISMGAVPVLVDILHSEPGDRATEAASLALAQLMFCKEGADALQNDKGLVEKLKRIREKSSQACVIETVLTSMKRFGSSKKKLKGIKKKILGFNKKKGDVYTEDELVAEAAEAMVEAEVASHHGLIPAAGPATNRIMISYSWQCQKQVLKIAESLQAAGFDVWLDVEQMTGSTIETMAAAVEESAIVLMCCSSGYKESVNCRLEAEYAFQSRKDLVPVLLEKGYNPNGWLGALCGSRLFFDFTEAGKQSASMKQLIAELGRKVSTVATTGTEKATTVKEDAKVASKSIDDLSVEAVQDWLQSMELPANIPTNFRDQGIDGCVLAVLEEGIVSVRDLECLNELGFSQLASKLRFWKALKVLVRSNGSFA